MHMFVKIHFMSFRAVGQHFASIFYMFKQLVAS
jgi:hypothetical protein